MLNMCTLHCLKSRKYIYNIFEQCLDHPTVIHCNFQFAQVLITVLGEFPFFHEYCNKQGKYTVLHRIRCFLPDSAVTEGILTTYPLLCTY